MQEKNIEKELDKAIGNVEIEGHSISNHEKEIVYKIYQKYRDRLGREAINSLFYGLVEEARYMEENYGKNK